MLTGLDPAGDGQGVINTPTPDGRRANIDGTGATQDFIIGVKASAKLRGDTRTFTLLCKKTNGKTTKTTATGNAGTRYCKKGALNIRTYGAKLNFRITWKAPATGDYAAYTKVKSTGPQPRPTGQRSA